MIITKGNVVKIGGGIKIIESTSIVFEVIISGEVADNSYYNSANFPLYPFDEEGIPGEIRTYNNKTYRYNYGRWFLLDLTPFGIIGTKDQIRQSGNLFYKFTGIDVSNPAWDIQSVSEMKALTFPFGKVITLWVDGFGAAIGNDNKKREGIVYVKDSNGEIAQGSVYSWNSIEYKWDAVVDYIGLSFTDQNNQNIISEVNGFINDKLEGPIKELTSTDQLKQYLTR